jgi:hypothetical protein
MTIFLATLKMTKRVFFASFNSFLEDDAAAWGAAPGFLKDRGL